VTAFWGKSQEIRLKVPSDGVDKVEVPASLCFTNGGKTLHAGRAW